MITPMQPIVFDAHDTIRFQPNMIVEYLFEIAEQHGIGMNELAAKQFTDEDRAQFAQLIGYSVSGWGGLRYVPTRQRNRADAHAQTLFLSKFKPSEL